MIEREPPAVMKLPESYLADVAKQTKKLIERELSGKEKREALLALGSDLNKFLHNRPVAF